MKYSTFFTGMALFFGVYALTELLSKNETNILYIFIAAISIIISIVCSKRENDQDNS